MKDLASHNLEATQCLECHLGADNLTLQKGCDVESLFQSSALDTWLRQGKRLAREDNVITSNWDAILHQKTDHKELIFSIVTKMTLRFVRTIMDDGKQMNTIVAVEGLGVFAWVTNERGSADQLKPLEKKLNVSQMDQCRYVSILKACIDGDNKNNPNKNDIWVVADRLEDM